MSATVKCMPGAMRAAIAIFKKPYRFGPAGSKTLIEAVAEIIDRETHAAAMVEVLKDELADLDIWLRKEGIPDSVKSAMLIREDRIGRVLRDAGVELHG